VQRTTNKHIAAHADVCRGVWFNREDL